MKDLSTAVRRVLSRLAGKKQGQGVIEYAGAMIVAALIVAAVMTVGKTGMSNVYNTVFNGVQNYFNTQAGNL